MLSEKTLTKQRTEHQEIWASFRTNSRHERMASYETETMEPSKGLHRDNVAKDNMHCV